MKDRTIKVSLHGLRHSVAHYRRHVHDRGIRVEIYLNSRLEGVLIPLEDLASISNKDKIEPVNIQTLKSEFPQYASRLQTEEIGAFKVTFHGKSVMYLVSPDAQTEATD
jgi:hypothetical protein